MGQSHAKVEGSFQLCSTTVVQTGKQPEVSYHYHLKAED